jgi:SagB-type dehydrogenase family enzyme
MKLFLQESYPPRAIGTQFNVNDPTEILHEQTKFHRATFSGTMQSIVRYLTNPTYIAKGVYGYKKYDAAPPIDLPAPQDLTVALDVVLKQRRSDPKVGGSISLAALSTMLYHALAVREVKPIAAAPHLSQNFRAYPSPGGLFGAEFYLYLNHVEGITPCIAHYDPRAHQLRVLRTISPDEFGKVEAGSGRKETWAPVILISTLVPQRATNKYGGRGYRMGLLEVGHASQNICLTAEGVGLRACAWGSYFDDELADALGIDGVTETVAAVILLGERSDA